VPALRRNETYATAVANNARRRRMTIRGYRPFVILAALALSGCPFKFKFNVENGDRNVVALRQAAGDVPFSAGDRIIAAAPSSEKDPGPRRPPGE